MLSVPGTEVGSKLALWQGRVGVVAGASAPPAVWVRQQDTSGFHDTRLLLSKGPLARTAAWQGRGRDHLLTHSLNGELRGAPSSGPPPSESVSTWSPCLPWDRQEALAKSDANSARFPGLKLHLEPIFIKCIDRFRFWKMELSQKALK